MRKLLALALIAALPAAQAEVYRWVDKDGVVHYTDRAPSKDAKPAALPPIQTISSGSVNTSTAPEAAAAVAVPAYGVSITSPQPEETFRNADRPVAVSAAASKPLPPDGGYIYYLDGNAQNSVGMAGSFTLTGVERGSHLIAVAAVDGSGQELGRSAPVIIHMMPPAVSNPGGPLKPAKPPVKPGAK